ncbi:MAG: CidA/LrgA family protein [Eubacterium sp.]|nr:CidA/LrgA family protein [Eubacterium sp.]
MKYVKQCLIIFAITLIGEALHACIPLPIPTSLYGLFLLFICLQRKWILPEQVKTVGTFLIEILPVLFVPAAVGLVEAWGLLRDRLLVYLLVTVSTTILVMIMTGIVTQWVIRRGKEKSRDF